VDGSPNTGPTWLNLYKREHKFSVPAEGYTLGPDDSDEKWNEYLRESILNPAVKIVDTYQNVMPPQASLFSGSPYKDKKLAAIVEYIKSLDRNGPGGAPKYYHPMSPPSERKQP
jgi:hypothetical protein